MGTDTDMPRVLRTTRRLQKETWELERLTGLDGQGMPSYASPVEFDANVVDYDMVGQKRGQAFVVMSDGSEVLVRKTLYVEGDESDIPDEGDRVGPPGEDEDRFIVAERSALRGLRRPRDENDHVRLRVRDE